ncbi:unnamed protein product [Paramecium pentaurelia]|uniref:Uncharacterized protein n=1 Tax=Paramecium pentaurelia TaxID=43138 RepID=A0A8S1VHT1_9CILI|nr:unnamed protein product [Paramecium pentaurelia]
MPQNFQFQPEKSYLKLIQSYKIQSIKRSITYFIYIYRISNQYKQRYTCSIELIERTNDQKSFNWNQESNQYLQLN